MEAVPDKVKVTDKEACYKEKKCGRAENLFAKLNLFGAEEYNCKNNAKHAAGNVR